MPRIYCRNTGTFREFTEGTTLLEMLPAFEFHRPCDILAAKVNNVTEGLLFKVFNNKDVEFTDYRSYIGRNVYCRSLCLLLCKAAEDIFPGCRVSLRRPISKGYFCSIARSGGEALSEAGIEAISARMNELVELDLPFRRHDVQAGEAVGLFRSLGRHDAARLMETCGDVYISYYSLDGYSDYYCGSLVPSTGYLRIWSLTPYRDGMILRVPDRHHPDRLAPFYEQPKTFDVFSEAMRWNRIMKLDNVGDVNRSCLNGNASDLILVAEALQEKKIVQIAEEIERRSQGAEPVKLVLITGPSSSGKSTFCKRLSVQLKACGLHPVSFSTDDYFVNRLDTPKLPDGNYDFDNFDTVDHDYLQSDVLKLLAGEEVEVPEYNFVSGIREFNGKRLRLGEGAVLLVEGIHALNPMLTDKVPASSKLHPHERQQAAAPHRARLQDGLLQRPPDHIQLAQRAQGRGEMDLSLPGGGRRAVQLRIPRGVRGAAQPRGEDTRHRPEELPGIRRGPQAAALPALLHPGVRQGDPAHFTAPQLHRRQQLRIAHEQRWPIFAFLYIEFVIRLEEFATSPS